MMKTITLKAPKWFLEFHEEMNKVEEEMAEILGVGAHWLAQQQGKSIAGLVQDRNLSDIALEKLKIIQIYRNTLSKYTWSKLRYDNLESEIDLALAPHLYFDSEEKKIIIKEDPIEKIQKFIKETVNKFKGVIQA